MHTASSFIAVVLGLALTLGAGPAQAETVNCTPITAVPIVITAQGIYCFTQDVTTSMTSGNAIEIDTNNVILDRNGWKLGGLAAGRGTNTIGISATDRQSITIKNGTVRGFLGGIALEDTSGASQGYVVEDIRADHNTVVGIEVDGHGSLIRNNLVVATGGSTSCLDCFAAGIRAGGAVSRVLNNDVFDTTNQNAGLAWGINFAGVAGGMAVNNRITNADVGILYSGGATGKFRDNLTFSVTTPYSGTGTDVGNNH